MLTLLGQRVAELGDGARPGGAQNVEELPLLRLLDDELDGARRQLQSIGELRRRLGAAGIHRLGREIEEVGELQPGFLDALRRRRGGAHDAFQVGGIELAERDEVIAQDAAARLLALQRLGHVGGRHKALRHQNIAEQHRSSPTLT